MPLSTIAEELEKSRDALLYNPEGSVLLSMLKLFFPNLGDKVFILDWIPEPGIEFYTLLVDGKDIVKGEISTESDLKHPMVFKVTPLRDYLKTRPTMSKRSRKELNTAIKLSKTPQPNKIGFT